MSEFSLPQQLTNRDSARLRSYSDYLDFYRGSQWSDRERWGEKHLTFNYARVFIDKLTSYLMAGVTFPVDSLEDSDAARSVARQAEISLQHCYDISALSQLDYETETDCAILGDGCYKVIWDPKQKRVRVTAPDVRGIFAWWQGDDIAQIWRVASRYSLSREEAGGITGNGNAPVGAGLEPARLAGGGLKAQGSQLKAITITELWTSDTFELYYGNDLVEDKPNPYGFIPFIIFPNLREPKQFWGTSDLVSLIEPQRELNRAMSQISRILELSGNPIAVLENVEESHDIAVKPGAVWNIPEDAKAYLVDLLQGGGLQLHINYIDLLYRALHDISEAPRAAFGGMDRDLSGTALQIELYPLLQKVLRKRAIRSSVYTRRNWMILKLLHQFAGGPDPDNLRLRIAWGEVMPQDHARQVANEQILVNNGIHSRRRAMDALGVADPEAEFKLWLEEEGQIGEVKGQNSKGKSESPK